MEFYGFPDGIVEYGLPLRRAVARAVRQHRPDVHDQNWREIWGPGNPNQADHIAVGRAALDGARDAGNRWVFRELGGLEPWKGRAVLVRQPGRPARRRRDRLATGVASLQAHEQYLRGLGDKPMSDPTEFLEAFARQAGSRFGVAFAVAFEVVNL